MPKGSTALVNRAAPRQIAGVLPATRTTDIMTFPLAPRASLQDRCCGWGEAACPPVSMTTADGDWYTAMTLGASPYRLVLLFIQSSVLHSLLTSLLHVVIGLALMTSFIRGVTLQLLQRLDYRLTAS